VRLTVEVAALAPGARLLAPLGMTTPHEAVTELAVRGGRMIEVLRESDLGLGACVIEADGGVLTLDYTADADRAGPYPEAAFVPRHNVHTTAAAALVAASVETTARAGGGQAAIAALVAETEARFVYDHPEARFNEGTDAVPYLACGATPGSCVDINTYLVASLRAAGHEAAYVYGYFFPEERGGITHDMHCWVVTRHEGAVLEWDIAHHMKAQLGATRAGLNPRPGARIALGHSMGHRYGGLPEIKLLAEPALMVDGAPAARVPLVARLAPMAAPARLARSA